MRQDACELIRGEPLSAIAGAVALAPEYLVGFAEIRKAFPGILLHLDQSVPQVVVQGDALLPPVLGVLLSEQDGVVAEINVLPYQSAQLGPPHGGVEEGQHHVQDDRRERPGIGFGKLPERLEILLSATLAADIRPRERLDLEYRVLIDQSLADAEVEQGAEVARW